VTKLKDFAGSVLAFVAFLLVFGVCNVLPAKQEYEWAEAYLAGSSPVGWTLIFVNRDSDITKPWTIFNPRPVGLYFVKSDGLVIDENGRRYVPALSVYRRSPPIEEDRHFDLVDCSDSRLAYVEIPRTGGLPTIPPQPSWYPSGSGGNAFPAVIAAICKL
jgi:hypothetical protein